MSNATIFGDKQGKNQTISPAYLYLISQYDDDNPKGFVYEEELDIRR